MMGKLLRLVALRQFVVYVHVIIMSLIVFVFHILAISKFFLFFCLFCILNFNGIVRQDFAEYCTLFLMIAKQLLTPTQNIHTLVCTCLCMCGYRFVYVCVFVCYKIVNGSSSSAKLSI